VVLDADDLITGALLLPAAIPVDSMPHGFDTSQLLRVDMKQIAGGCVFVAPRRILLFLELPDPADALGFQMLRDGRHQNIELTGDLPARLPSPPELNHATNEFLGRSAWQALRATARIVQAVAARFLESIQPLVSGLAAHACAASRLSHRPVPKFDPVDQKLTRLRS